MIFWCFSDGPWSLGALEHDAHPTKSRREMVEKLQASDHYDNLFQVFIVL
jgi:hypothetical protein